MIKNMLYIRTWGRELVFFLSFTYQNNKECLSYKFSVRTLHVKEYGWQCLERHIFPMTKYTLKNLRGKMVART